MRSTPHHRIPHRDVVLEHPLEVLVVVGVDRLDILERYLCAQHVLVERPGEVGIDQLAIVERLADDVADELEVVEVGRPAARVVLDLQGGRGRAGRRFSGGKKWEEEKWNGGKCAIPRTKPRRAPSSWDWAGMWCLPRGR